MFLEAYRSCGIRYNKKEKTLQSETTAVKDFPDVRRAKVTGFSNEIS